MLVALKISGNDNGYQYGNCVTLALSLSFNVDVKVINMVCDLMKYRGYQKGLTFNQCKKLVHFLGKRCNKHVMYFKNTDRMKYFEIVETTKSFNFKMIAVFPEHVSFAHNGEVIDSFIREDYMERMNWKPTGYWLIF